MTTSLFVTPQAERDLTAIFLWYEQQREGVGPRFIDAADELSCASVDRLGCFLKS